MRRLLPMFLLITLLPILASCDSGLGVVSVRLGEFPESIVYYVNEFDEVDLTGATIITLIRDGRVFENDIDSDSWLDITDNVDFSTPGLYEVVIRRSVGGDIYNDNIVGRIPIQVVEREGN